MDIRAFKSPSGKDHFFNINLPHTPYPDLLELDVLLVVPDVTGRDPDHVVGEVKDVLLNSEYADKIKVREVLTLKQFRDDYSTYEAKRELAKSVDVVIAESKVWKMILSILGREFIKKKKFPLHIPGRKLKKADIGKQIWLALHKTVLNLSLKGVNSTLVVSLFVSRNLKASHILTRKNFSLAHFETIMFSLFHRSGMIHSQKKI